ncbi:MAG: hypothetical protein INR65_09550, partial [Gluconacetobacter diazotrophicus]|nr:hypothetical protein [Gluconacetobacter diazotrophicus]
IPEIAALACTGGSDAWSAPVAKPDGTAWNGDAGTGMRHQNSLQERNERIRTLELAFEARGT